MPSAAPRMPQRLLDVVERLATRPGSIAEINRSVGAEAERLGLARPSYEQVRVLVHEARRLRALGPSRGEAVAEMLLRTVPTERDLERLAEPRPRLRDRAPKAK